MNIDHKVGSPAASDSTAMDTTNKIDDVTLHSAWYCPFAQRTWATLEHLGIPYKYRETDPYHKSPEWMEISRGTGQVPVIEISVNDGAPFRVPGSLRSLEYLEDVQDESIELFSANPSNRAEARYWSDFQGANIIPYFYRFLKADRDSMIADEAKGKMLIGLQTFAEAMSSDGAYFTGDAPSLVDFAFAPFALRIDLILGYYKDFTLPTTGETWTRYATWWAAMKRHPAMLSTMPEPETYKARLIEFYLPYSKGGGQEDVTNVA